MLAYPNARDHLDPYEIARLAGERQGLATILRVMETTNTRGYTFAAREAEMARYRARVAEIDRILNHSSGSK